MRDRHGILHSKELNKGMKPKPQTTTVRLSPWNNKKLTACVLDADFLASRIPLEWPTALEPRLSQSSPWNSEYRHGQTALQPPRVEESEFSDTQPANARLASSAVTANPAPMLADKPNGE